MGGFEPQIRRILSYCLKSGTCEEALSGFVRQTLFFTATWPVVIQRVAASFTNGCAKQVRIAQGSLGNDLTANSSITQKDIIVAELKGNECAIVFATRKATCDEMQNWVLGCTIPSKRGGREIPLASWCRAIHGDKEQ